MCATSLDATLTCISPCVSGRVSLRLGLAFDARDAVLQGRRPHHGVRAPGRHEEPLHVRLGCTRRYVQLTFISRQPHVHVTSSSRTPHVQITSTSRNQRTIQVRQEYASGTPHITHAHFTCNSCTPDKISGWRHVHVAHTSHQSRIERNQTMGYSTHQVRNFCETRGRSLGIISTKPAQFSIGGHMPTDASSSSQNFNCSAVFVQNLGVCTRFYLRCGHSKFAKFRLTAYR